MFLITGVLLSILFLVIIAYLWHIRSAYDFFTNLNIPGPRPTLFFGNFLDVIKTRRLSQNIRAWTKTYGRVFGFYEGHTPVLVVSDPDILQDVFIKSFSNFHSRRLLPLTDEKAKRVSMFIANGLRWKRQRYIINPTFSSSKLKQMTPLVHRSIQMFMKKMSEEYDKKQPFDIYNYFKRFTMDTIWSCGFSIDTDMQNNINDPYLVHSQRIFGENVNVRLVILLAIFVHELNRFWRALSLSTGYLIGWLHRHVPLTKKLIEENPGTWISTQVYDMIDIIQNNKENKRTDLLQLMLESATDEESIQVE